MGPDIIFLLLFFGDETIFKLERATWAEVAASPLTWEMTFSKIWGSNNSFEKGEEEAKRFFWGHETEAGK